VHDVITLRSLNGSYNLEKENKYDQGVIVKGRLFYDINFHRMHSKYVLTSILAEK